jgi:integrase
MIRPDLFDVKRECVKAKAVFDAVERKRIDRAISERKELIKKLCVGVPDKSILTSEWLDAAIDRELHPEKYISRNKQTFFEAFEECVSTRNISDARKSNFRVVIRALRRYELYIRAIKGKQNFVLSLNTVSSGTLQSFSDYLKNEHEYYCIYPELYNAFPKYKGQKPRGQNTVNGIMVKIRTFFIWAVANEKTANNPFSKFAIDESVYGTPYYISIDERNCLYRTDMSQRPALAVQRDIFVFQCLIGCRIADLYKLTRENIINGAVEYIARKTKDGRPVTVRVPLNSIAKEILDRYSGHEGDALFPFISMQRYNDAIKDAFTVAGLTRNVVILDPLTRESVIRPLNGIASSHLARRCFVGNLYRQVKDQNLVSALSGHKEGSNAFARYRDIDEDMKSELVKLLE